MIITLSASQLKAMTEWANENESPSLRIEATHNPDRVSTILVVRDRFPQIPSKAVFHANGKRCAP